MTQAINFTSYSQEEAEKLIAACLKISDISVKYVTTYDSGVSWSGPDDSAVVRRIKEELLEEYSDLWKELSNR